MKEKDPKYTGDTSAILEGIYPMVEKSLSKGTAKYKACVGRYLSSRSDIIYDTCIYNNIYFGEAEIDDFFKSMGIKIEDIITELKKTYFWELNFSPKAAKDPFTVTMIMVIRYFYKKKMEKELELSCIYLAFSGKFYASTYTNSFPNSVQSREAMEYTVNFKLTQKFDLKKEGSVFGAVKQMSRTWINSYGDKLDEPDDADVAYVIQQMHTRIKSIIVNIAIVYYDTFDNKEYLNYESDNISDNPDTYRLTDNNALAASRFTENAMNYLTNSNVNYAFCKMCSDSNVKTDEIKDIISSITHDNTYLPQIRDVINILIADYMRNNPKEKDVSSISFLSYSIKAKPNTKDKDLLRLKSTIESWLDENSPNYRRRKSREATKNSYYKAILEYIVLVINKSNK